MAKCPNAKNVGFHNRNVQNWQISFEDGYVQSAVPQNGHDFAFPKIHPQYIEKAAVPLRNRHKLYCCQDARGYLPKSGNVFLNQSSTNFRGFF